MKVTITIEIETHENNPPTVEVSQVDAPHLTERTQTTLEEFTGPSIGEELSEAFKPRNGSSRVGVPTYQRGRETHRCSNCNAPHRRIITGTGYCKEPTCESGVWQG